MHRIAAHCSPWPPAACACEQTTSLEAGMLLAQYPEPVHWQPGAFWQEPGMQDCEAHRSCLLPSCLCVNWSA